MDLAFLWQIASIIWAGIVSIFTTGIPAVFSVVTSFLPVYKFISSINDYFFCVLLGLPIIPLCIILIKLVRKNITKSFKH